MLMPEMTPEIIISLFDWISRSVRIASRAVSVSPTGETATVGLPTPPNGLQIIL
jgi:hypothetical protein